ncbi:hypothetical protein L226DRAFT_188993 [Lentinus tigrinus ALCF2SS1-7]|uniref:uncharacterized protein n=1 Tax=Lentinus tigrinus ALCF2SS1-7 TaxID=1328758 RepID=UPI0011663239|nr:hypothetical protein L226DRAFT_188993 [Lentinus tigrinus ALCF2SS1-7]
MCHRQLRLWKATQCGHLIFSGETNIDCGSRDCFNSSAHPPDCGAPGSGTVCRCRRYYTCVLSFFLRSPFVLTSRPKPTGAYPHTRGQYSPSPHTKQLIEH